LGGDALVIRAGEETTVCRRSGRGLAVSLIALLVAAAFLAFVSAPASAQKTHVFQEVFGSAAQPAFGSANSIAADQASGDLLVIDSQAKAVLRFNSDGTPDNFSALGTNRIDASGGSNCPVVPADCDQTPQGGFQFSSFAGEQQIAIDNSGTITNGNIYVTQGKQAAGNLVDIFAADGKYIGQLTAAGTTPFGTTGSLPFSPCGVAVDGSGNVYLAGGFDKAIYKFDPTANPPVNADNVVTFSTGEKICNLAAGAGPTAGSLFVNTFFTNNGKSVLRLDSSSGTLQGIVESGEASLVSVDPGTGHVYVAGSDGVIREYDASGSSGPPVSTFPSSGNGIALNGTTGRIYLSGREGRVYVYTPLVTVPDVTTEAATITGDTSATLNGTVDADGVALEECFFEYGPNSAYGQTVPCAETVGEIGLGKKAVHADLAGLSPESLYHYRLVAKNTNATIQGEDESFKTPSKPAIEGPWSTDVGFSEATLRAEVNPENSPTSYRFEYGLDTSYGQSTAQIPIGTAAGLKAVSLPLSGLVPGVTYHYRVVATNNVGATTSPDGSLVTYPLTPAPKADCPNQAFRGGASANLPDCRAFEMVSPVDKGNADIAVRLNGPNLPAGFDQSATDGNGFAYSSEKAFGDALTAPFTSQYLATRTDGVGWSTQAIAAPRGRPVRELGADTNNNANVDTDYKIFAPDLSSGWFIHNYDPPLSGCAGEGYANLYRRDSAGSYEAITTAAPTNQNPPRYWPALQGTSADGSVTVFTANAKLTANASAAKEGVEPIYQLYQHVRDPNGGCGELRLLSVLPNGNAASSPSSLGTPQTLRETRESTLLNALSTDGTHTYWSTAIAGPGALYLSVEGQKTAVVSANSARYWAFAADGSRAIYEVRDDEKGIKDLFEYDAAAKASKLIAKGSAGLVGASNDLSRLYFVSSEALGGEGTAGQPNLYLREGVGAGATTKLVGTLAAADLTPSFSQTPVSVVAPEPIKRSTRVSPDGATLAFLSAAPLTGYDNKDATDGKPNLELYRYAAGNGELLCVSCNPSGARPVGREIEGAESNTRRVAALLPAWETQDFAPRALSDDGRQLFFQSFDDLLPTDTNGAADVYEWQAATAAAQCTERGAALYVAASSGCLSLISSGKSPNDSELIDASPNGRDVFFKTASSLLPQDPGLIDIYDAREGGGLPLPPAPEPECEGESCQPPASVPNDSAPSSQTFNGPGNVKPAKPKCKKPKVARKGHCVKPKKQKKANKKQAAKKRATHNGRAGR
jgi:hypothetical protein